MNMQSLMQQAQKMQRDIAKKQDELEKMEFTGSSEFLTLTLKGDNTLKDIKFKIDSLDKEDIDILEDMIKIAYNDAKKQLDAETKNKMGSYGNMGGLF